MNFNIRCQKYDELKAPAIILMIIDHIGLFYLKDYEFLRLIGRGSAPIFFFLVGYSNSTKINNNLVIWAILLQIVLIINNQHQLNILFTIIILKFLNKLVENNKINNSIYSSITLGLVGLLLYFPFSFVQYSSFYLVAYFAGRITAIKPKNNLINYVGLSIIYSFYTLILGFDYHYFIIFIYLMLVFIMFYYMKYHPISYNYKQLQ